VTLCRSYGDNRYNILPGDAFAILKNYCIKKWFSEKKKQHTKLTQKGVDILTEFDLYRFTVAHSWP